MALTTTYFFYFPYTCRGRKVTSLGVLYDFTGNDHNTTVQKVEDMVKEAWVSCIPCLYLYPKGSNMSVQFADAIKDEPDFFLLVGYVPVVHLQWTVIEHC